MTVHADLDLEMKEAKANKISSDDSRLVGSFAVIYVAGRSPAFNITCMLIAQQNKESRWCVSQKNGKESKREIDQVL